eukprot:2748707-Rhodomonas_salina.1
MLTPLVGEEVGRCLAILQQLQPIHDVADVECGRLPLVDDCGGDGELPVCPAPEQHRCPEQCLFTDQYGKPGQYTHKRDSEARITHGKLEAACPVAARIETYLITIVDGALFGVEACGLEDAQVMVLLVHLPDPSIHQLIKIGVVGLGALVRHLGILDCLIIDWQQPLLLRASASCQNHNQSTRAISAQQQTGTHPEQLLRLSQPLRSTLCPLQPVLLRSWLHLLGEAIEEGLALQAQCRLRLTRPH